MASDLGFCIVGCGMIARFHIRALAEIPGTRVTALVDSIPGAPERCDRVIGACDRGGVKLCTIFPSRFHDANLALKAAVDAGRFGRLTLGETTCKWWRSQEDYDKGGWRGTWKLDGGGAMMNQAVHNVDLLLWLMGPATHVCGFTATLAHERIEVEDTAVACLRFRNGALGII